MNIICVFKQILQKVFLKIKVMLAKSNHVPDIDLFFFVLFVLDRNCEKRKMDKGRILTTGCHKGMMWLLVTQGINLQEQITT